MKYKAVITDVDGTLVPNHAKGKVSPRVVSAINCAKDLIHVGVATARSSVTMQPIFDQIKLSGPCVLTGGAQVIDPVSHKVYKERLISHEAFAEIKKQAELFDTGLIVADEHGEQIVWDNYKPSKIYDLYSDPMSMENAHKFIQMLSYIPTIMTHKALAWGDTGEIHVMITHPEATKQQGILDVAEILGISTHEIIGIGEGYNDFPLLMACGLKVAMGNAVADLKEIADYVAPTVADDGVADVIEKFILNQ
jgi:Cof subfamily protein (haloacid dehalogenase superfamily)